MSDRTSNMALRATLGTEPIPFPTQYQPPEPTRGEYVTVESCPGANSVRFVYVDAEHYRRLEMVIDAAVPEGERSWLQKILKAVGDKLPPVSPARRPIIGPRLVP